MDLEYSRNLKRRMKSYREVGTLYNDCYEDGDDDFMAEADYDFLVGLNVGDVIQISSEIDNEPSRFIYSIDLDDNEWVESNQLVIVKRKIYSGEGLDVYVSSFIEPTVFN